MTIRMVLLLSVTALMLSLIGGCKESGAPEAKTEAAKQESGPETPPTGAPEAEAKTSGPETPPTGAPEAEAKTSGPETPPTGAPEAEAPTEELASGNRRVLEKPEALAEAAVMEEKAKPEALAKSGDAPLEELPTTPPGEKAASADRRVSDRTVAGIMGSESGAGDGGAMAQAGSARVKAESGAWGEGDIVVGGVLGGPKSDLFAGNDGSLAAVVAEGARGPGILGRNDLGLGLGAGPGASRAIPDAKLRLLTGKESDPVELPTADPAGENYQHVNENPFKKVLEEPVSTFSIDVDTASYANVRRFINSGQLPPPDAVRIEEMINYFRYDYPQPDGEVPFAVHATITDCPWAPKHRLARVALQGREVKTADLPPSNLVFLLDVSGSMNNPDKLPLLKAGLVFLLEELRPTDRVAIVVYAGAAGLVLPSTPGSDKTAILGALDGLSAGGSTAGGAGINLAYQVAKDNFIEGGNNRVILGTDGDFNVGVSGTGALVSLIETKRDEGVFLTVLGFGTGNYHEEQMEQLANKGNGNFAYIDSIKEARKVLSTEFGGTLFTIAKDVKIQIEFNPTKVASYRLIGYENRVMAREDFDDDKKDAGELGSGHRVTAFYELTPASGEPGAADETRYTRTTVKEGDATSNELMLVKLRWKAPDSDTSTKIEQPVLDDGVKFSKTDRDLQFAAAVAAFGMVLKGSAHKGDATFELVKELATPALGDDKEGLRKELLELVEIARGARAYDVGAVAPRKQPIKARARCGPLSEIVGGPIDRVVVEKVLRRRTIALQRCYEKVLTKNPKAGGKLFLQVTVATNGRAEVEVISDLVGDPGVARCVIRKIRSWRFPKPETQAATFKVPVVFRSL